MIMENTRHFEQEEQEPEGIFENILEAANSHWGEISFDAEQKHATGVMTTSDGRVYTAELSYNDVKNRLSLIVRLHLERHRPAQHPQQVLKFQYRTYGLLSFLTVDEETPLASIRALTAVPPRETECAVASIFADTYILLEDDELNQLVNSTR